MNSGIFSTSRLLVAQDLWIHKDARKSVKAKKAAFGPLYLAAKSQGCGKSGIKLRLLSWRLNDVHLN